MKFLIVVDTQIDFITGALANKEAQKRLPNVVNKIIEAQKKNYEVILTQDTHYDNYLETLEGKKLPVPHCIVGTDGHKIVKEVRDILKAPSYTSKRTFGDLDIGRFLEEMAYDNEENVDEIEIIGFVSSICVISNALILRASFPNVPIIIDASCCAGLTKEDHDAAMTVAQCCQIDVINWER